VPWPDSTTHLAENFPHCPSSTVESATRQHSDCHHHPQHQEFKKVKVKVKIKKGKKLGFG
jgi:hypothetical protein